MKKSASPRSKRAIELTLGALFSLVGLVCAAWLGPATFMRSHASQSFVATPAVVRSIEIDETQTKNGPLCKVYITYAYEVGGITYASCDWRVAAISGFGRPRTFEGRAAAEAVAAQYRVGSRFDAFVDPNDATTAVVVRGTNEHGWWYIGWGLVLGAMGVFALRSAFEGEAPVATATST